MPSFEASLSDSHNPRPGRDFITSAQLEAALRALGFGDDWGMVFSVDIGPQRGDDEPYAGTGDWRARFIIGAEGSPTTYRTVYVPIDTRGRYAARAGEHDHEWKRCIPNSPHEARQVLCRVVGCGAFLVEGDFNFEQTWEAAPWE